MLNRGYLPNSILIAVAMLFNSPIVRSLEEDVSKKPHLVPGLQWEFNALELITTQAVAEGDSVVFGTINGKLYAIDKMSGKKKWVLETGGSILSSPAIRNGLVYFGSCDNSFYAVDLKSGDVVWKFITDREIESSPIVSGELVYFTSVDGHLYALDKTSGSEKWRFRTGGCILSSPIISKGMILFGSWDTAFYAVDSSSGKEKWRFKTGGIINSDPVLSGDSVIFGSDDSTIYALDIHNGNLHWKKPTELSMRGRPCIAGNLLVYIIYHSMTHEALIKTSLYVLNMDTREIIWKSKSQLVDPVVNNDVLYYSTVEIDGEWSETYIYSMDIGTKNVLWKFSVGSCTLSFDDNTLFIVGCDSTVYSVDTQLAEKEYHP